VTGEQLQPHLMKRPAPPNPSRRSPGLVVMLHGGADTNTTPIGSFHRPWVRSRLMMQQLLPGLHRAGLDVWLLRYRHVGWNARGGDRHSPVPDVRWALDQARPSYDADSRTVVLLGHSMGARAAVAVADDELVRGVVALAPWFPPGEPVKPLTGKRLVAAHGRHDRITRFAHTEAFVGRAGSVAERVQLVDMADRGHYMLKGADAWNTVARTHILEMFLDEP
jgi:predicted esterase